MVKIMETKNRMVISRGWEERRRGVMFSGHRVLVLQDEESFGAWMHNSVNVLNTTELDI